MSEALEQGMAAAKSGDRAQASRWLQQALKEDPRSSLAWLWLAAVLDDPEKQEYCLRRVLALDPGNAQAEQGLRLLRQPVQEAPPAAAPAAPPAETPAGAAPEAPRGRFEFIGRTEAGGEWAGDPYEPHMPAVDVYSDLDFFFEAARLLGHQAARTGFLAEFEQTHPELRGRVMRVDTGDEKQIYVSLITPGRMIWLLPGVMPNVANRKKPLPDAYLPRHKKKLRISVIGYNRLDAVLGLRSTAEIQAGPTMEGANKCIPFLGFLLAYAGMLGHSVLIFEGHASALAAGLKDSDVLFIDSAMLPHLQPDWAEVAFGSMSPHARVYIHDRGKYRLLPIIRRGDPPGWAVGRGIGNESSYLHLLLTILNGREMKGRRVAVTTGKRLPDLSRLTRRQDQLDFIAGIPFDYDILDPQVVIKNLMEMTRPKFLSSRRVYQSSFGGQKISIEFHAQLTSGKGGGQSLVLWVD